jgi:hypothetical protein
MITSFISHRWFSGKISRCHPALGQYRLAPGSIPGRCIFSPLVQEGEKVVMFLDGGGGGRRRRGWNEQRFLLIGARVLVSHLP